MSMQINHMRSLLQISLPLILFISLAGFATWKGLQSTPLSIGSRLILHQALTKIPAESPQMNRTIAKQSGRDPFFRNTNEKVASQIKDVPEPANLEEINLTTIAQGKQGRYCIINGEIFHEKQVGKNFTVEEIAQNQVAFHTRLESFFLIPGQKATIQSGRLVPLDKVAIGSQVSLLEEQPIPYE